MDVTVRLLARREIPSAARLLARAFAADPFIGHFLEDSRRRRLAFPSFFGAVLHEHVPLGTVYAAEVAGTVIGVAAWTPPGPAPPGVAARVRARMCSTRIRALYPRLSRPLFAGFEAMAGHRPHEPHWHLAIVGIEPRLQGRGAGRTLLAPVLDRADADGVLCYLETPFAATFEFYSRLGFAPASTARPVSGAPPIWTMTRRSLAGTRPGYARRAPARRLGERAAIVTIRSGSHFTGRPD